MSKTELKPSKKQLDTLKVLGSSFFDWKQCAVILEMDKAMFMDAMKRPGSEIYKAYYGGFYESELKLRQSITDLAMRGSGPAQQQLLKIIDATKAANT